MPFLVFTFWPLQCRCRSVYHLQLTTYHEIPYLLWIFVAGRMRMCLLSNQSSVLLWNVLSTSAIALPAPGIQKQVPTQNFIVAISNCFQRLEFVHADYCGCNPNPSQHFLSIVLQALFNCKTKWLPPENQYGSLHENFNRWNTKRVTTEPFSILGWWHHNGPLLFSFLAAAMFLHSSVRCGSMHINRYGCQSTGKGAFLCVSNKGVS